MLNLAKINDKSTTTNKSPLQTKTIQNYVYNTLVSSKNKTLSFDEVFNLVIDYTLKPENQLSNWFDTPIKFETFVSDVSGANSKILFNTKYSEFKQSMNKKVIDLFFSVKHKRSFTNNSKYNTLVNVTSEKISLVQS